MSEVEYMGFLTHALSLASKQIRRPGRGAAFELSGPFLFLKRRYQVGQPRNWASLLAILNFSENL